MAARSMFLPGSIERSRRKATNAGRGSFHTEIHLSDSSAWLDQRIEVRGHAFFHAVRGGLIVQNERFSSFVEEGSAILIGDETVQAFGESPGTLEVTTFPAAVVRDVLTPYPMIESLLAGVANFDFPPQAIPQFSRLIRDAHVMSSNSPRFPLAEVLKVLMIDRLPAAVYACFGRTFYGPRLRLAVELEVQVLSGNFVPDVQTEMAARLYLGTTVADWLKRRRIELGRVWTNYSGHPISEVADAVHLPESELQMAISSREPANSALEPDQSWKNLQPAEHSSLIRPFWLPQSPRSESKEFPQNADNVLGDAWLDEYGNIQKTAQSESKEVSQNMLEDYWNMQNTGVGTIVPLPKWASSPIPLAA